MLKIDIKNGRMVVAIEGNVTELCADCLTAIHMVYDSIKEDDIIASESFKKMFLDMADVSFVGIEGLDEEFAKKRKKRNVNDPKVQEIIATLKEVIAILENGGSIHDALIPLYKSLEEKK